MFNDNVEVGFIGFMTLVVLGALFLDYSEAVRKNTRFESCMKTHSVAECTPLLKE